MRELPLKGATNGVVASFLWGLNSEGRYSVWSALVSLRANATTPASTRNLVDRTRAGTFAKHIAVRPLAREGHGIELGTDTARLVPPGPLCLTGGVTLAATAVLRGLARVRPDYDVTLLMAPTRPHRGRPAFHPRGGRSEHR